jgi:hypothetical protein
VTAQLLQKPQRRSAIDEYFAEDHSEASSEELVAATTPPRGRDPHDVEFDPAGGGASAGGITERAALSAELTAVPATLRPRPGRNVEAQPAQAAGSSGGRAEKQQPAVAPLQARPERPGDSWFDDASTSSPSSGQDDSGGSAAAATAKNVDVRALQLDFMAQQAAMARAEPKKLQPKPSPPAQRNGAQTATAWVAPRPGMPGASRTAARAPPAAQLAPRPAPGAPQSAARTPPSTRQTSGPAPGAPERAPQARPAAAQPAARRPTRPWQDPAGRNQRRAPAAASSDASNDGNLSDVEDLSDLELDGYPQIGPEAGDALSLPAWQRAQALMQTQEPFLVQIVSAHRCLNASGKPTWHFLAQSEDGFPGLLPFVRCNPTLFPPAFRAKQEQSQQVRVLLHALVSGIVSTQMCGCILTCPRCA